MKKLTVLAIALSIVAAASAAPAWNFTVGGTTVEQAALGDIVTASLTVDSLEVITGGSIGIENATIDSFTILGKAVGADPVNGGGSLDFPGSYIFGTDAKANFTAGDAMLTLTFAVDQAAVDAGVVGIIGSTLNYAAGGVVSAFPDAAIVTPEPMTLGLLGLGGLFLRRRK